MKKILWAKFSANIERQNVGEQHFLRVHKVFWQLFCKRYHHFFETLEVDRDKHFKKKLFSGDKRFGPFFPLIIECDKPQGTTYKGPKVVPTNTVKLARAFF